MAQRVILHVGAMKSGTSYLQRILAANADLLAERGLLFPGGGWAAQVRGVTDVLDRQRVVAAPPEGAWQSLVDELAAWSGDGVISMEFLGPAPVAKLAAVVGSFAPGSVRVVVTARDLGRTVPAMWQETLKNGRSRTFADYVDAIGTEVAGTAPDQAARGRLGKRFWREQDVAAMCRRWAEAVGPDHVSLVTVPPPGADAEELWRRFASALGVNPAGVRMPGPANESLGSASAEVLRLLNERLDGMAYADYAPVVKHQLAKQVMAARRTEEAAVGFEPPGWLRQRSAALVQGLRDLGIQVVGDLADLEPIAVPGVPPDGVPVGERLDAAVAALEGLVRQAATPRATGRRGPARGAD